MSDHFTVMGCGFLATLVCAAIFFSITFKNAFLRERLLSVVSGFVPSLLAGVGIVVAAMWYPFDFVQDMTLIKFLVPLLATLVVLVAVLLNKPYVVAGGVLVASVISVFGTGMFITFQATWPVALNKLLTVACLWGYAMGYRALSGLNPLPQIEGLVVGVGFVLLGLFGFAPMMLSVEATGIVAILLIAYVNSSRCSLGITGAPVLGFVLGSMGLISYGEYLLPCFVIFSMFYFAELLVSLLKKCSLLPQYSDVVYNSASAEAFSLGLPADTLIRMVFATNFILLLLGFFQIYAVNVYSLPAFAFILTVWQQHRMLHWQQESMTFKEVNKALVQDVKQSIADLLDWNKDKDKTDDHK